jgi:subtilisin family serine protease
MKLTSISIAAALCCLGHGAALADDARHPYIIQLADKPLASYSGGVAGLKATQPTAGKRIDLRAPDVQLYSQYLNSKQASVRAAIAAAPVQYQYQIAFNGFAAMLTDAEVRQLKARSDVAAITADAPRRLLTSNTPAFLGLDQPGGLWSQLGGKDHAGEDIVIGLLDTGAWPESPSYSDRVDASGVPTTDAGGTQVYGAPPAHWKGGCATGEGFEARFCNNKLVGAQFFPETFLANGGVPHSSEFLSPRDSLGGGVGSGGHGTHTSTTAGGNNGVQATVSGIAMGATSGMAPHARIAMYKVCWTNDDGSAAGENGCYISDSVAAVEKAILDGVDVLSFSISGGSRLDDPVDLAFLNAVNAGVFVAAAAGNEGPGNGTLSHIAPWIATVAASSHDRQLLATLKLANGTEYRGASMNTVALPQTALVRAEDAALSGADPLKAALCFSAGYNAGLAVLDPVKVKDKIVVCTRGTSPRVDKSLAVLEAGGAGMVLADDGHGVLAEVHSVPTVHLNTADGTAVSAYAKSAQAAAALSHFVATNGAPAPIVAAFSSRGPNLADSNVLKPDLSAPGVSILAGATPALTRDQRDAVAAGTLAPPAAWAIMDGTSMATPHVAGVAALLRQQHPAWSPAAIKSALMTSTRPTLPDEQTGDQRGTLPWGQGAGNLQPNKAADPGLVYDLGAADYARYLCYNGNFSQCGAGSAASYNLNLPSIALSNVAVSQTVTRTVTNVGSATATYSASATLPGYTVAVTPATLTLAPGTSASFQVKLTRNGAPDYQWQFGTLVWNDGSHTVTSPLLARPGNLVEAPLWINGSTTSGMQGISIGTNFNGRPATIIGGMKPVTRTRYTVAQAPYNSVDTEEQITAACQAGNAGVRVIPVTLAAQTMAARFELFNRDTGNGGNHDLDLALLDASGKLLAVSRLQGSDEAITMFAPAAGNYRVCVVGNWIADNRETSFDLSSSIITAADNNGTLKTSLPGKVYDGSYATVGVSWNGLATGQRYTGAIQYTDAGGHVGATTVVLIDTSDAVPLPLAQPKQAKFQSVQ